MTFAKPAIWVLVAIGVVVYLQSRRANLAIVPKNDANPEPIPPAQIPGGTIQCFRAPCPGSLDLRPNRRN